MKLLLLTMISYSTALNKGLPGISKKEKMNYNKGELFKYRNEMMKWYCTTNEKLDKIPCKVFMQLRKNINITSLNETESIMEGYGDKKLVMSDYRDMFLQFCNNAQIAIADKICSIQVFREKYTPSIETYFKNDTELRSEHSSAGAEVDDRENSPGAVLS